MSSAVRTLALVRTDTHLLLGYKKRGFGKGLWNGFGGKLEAGETLERAAQRELQEECGLVVTQLVHRGILHFTFTAGSSPLEVHVYEVRQWQGEPVETDEMRPQWFSLDDLPYTAMWPDDPYWLPQVLRGELLVGRFHFENPTTLVSSHVQTVAELPAIRQKLY